MEIVACWLVKGLHVYVTHNGLHGDQHYFCAYDWLVDGPFLYMINEPCLRVNVGACAEKQMDVNVVMIHLSVCPSYFYEFTQQQKHAGTQDYNIDGTCVHAI